VFRINPKLLSRPVPEWSSLDEWWREVGEAELRLILWAAWDPIGHVPRNEYDWYVPRLWELLRNHAAALSLSDDYEKWPEAEQQEWVERVHASEEEIAKQLGEWRTERIGLPPRPQEDRVIAMKLSDWLNPPNIDEFQPASLAR
jgi:hypothetical protein